MNLEEYQAEINKTWKSNPGLGDYEHCLVGIMEEAGEIAGWYKKANYYGAGMTEEIGRGLKGELGDLLYYTVKLIGLTSLEENTFNDIEILSPEATDYKLLMALNEASYGLTDNVYTCIAFAENVNWIVSVINEMALRQGWSLSDIMYSNIAKLKHRHGSDFDIEKAEPSNRDIVGEDGQIMMDLPRLGVKVPATPKKKSVLKSLRKKAGFSQSQVATVLGVSTSHICILEQGNTKLKERFIPILAKLYKCPKNVIEQCA